MAAPSRLALVWLSVAVAAAGCGSGPASAAPPSAVDSPAAAAPAADAATTAPTASSAPALSSPDFRADGAIPTRFTCTGAGDRPTLNWSGVPAGATSIAIVVTDPDTGGRTFTHWMVYGIPAAPSGSIPGGALPAGAHEEPNTSGKIGWKAPCPPSGTGVHHYHFVLYADRGPMAGGSAADTEVQIRKQAIAQASLIGTVAASS